MDALVTTDYRYMVEIRRTADLSSAPLFSQEVPAADLNELVAELHANAVLAQTVPDRATGIECHLEPRWHDDPIVAQLDVSIQVENADGPVSVSESFRCGRWSRVAQQATAQLREENLIADNELVYALLLALPSDAGQQSWRVPLETPHYVDADLAACGVRRLLPGQVLKDRPVLVNKRLVDDALARCQESGTTEAGAAVLGKIVRLPEPLPSTTTRLVTILSALVEDPRHQGSSFEFAFSSAALAEAMEIADLRGFDETVQTVYHSHGWAKECSLCQENGRCPLAKAQPSLRDYTMVESLVSSKATLVPIAGRRLGNQQDRPALEIYAWRGGELRAIEWSTYEE